MVTFFDDFPIAISRFWWFSNAELLWWFSDADILWWFSNVDLLWWFSNGDLLWWFVVTRMSLIMVAVKVFNGFSTTTVIGIHSSLPKIIVIIIMIRCFPSIYVGTWDFPTSYFHISYPALAGCLIVIMMIGRSIMVSLPSLLNALLARWWWW